MWAVVAQYQTTRQKINSDNVRFCTHLSRSDSDWIRFRLGCFTVSTNTVLYIFLLTEDTYYYKSRKIYLVKWRVRPERDRDMTLEGLRVVLLDRSTVGAR